MRMEPSEDFMYKRMDRKDRALLAMPVCGMAAFAGVVLAASNYPIFMWLPIILLSLLLFVAAALIYWKMKRLIMPVSGCFLELQGTCFFCVQPYLDDSYEKCRIDLQDVECLIRDRKKNGFYIKIHLDGKSVIQGGKEEMRKVMYICPMGYPGDWFDVLFQTIRDKLPEEVSIFEWER